MQIMSEDFATKNVQTAEGIGRRSLIGRGAALLAAASGVATTGVRSVAAESTPSDVSSPPSAGGP